MRVKPLKSVIAFMMAVMLTVTGAAIVPAEAQAAAAPAKIVLTSKSQTLYRGQSYTLKVKSVTPKNASKSVSFKTSRSSVALVNSKGKITAKKAGTAVITVTSKANKKVKATCKITVKEKPKKITLNATKKTLNVGSAYTLKVKSVSPKNAYTGVKYKSSNSKVAAVSTSGKITAKKAGSATITVTSKANSKVKAVCKITVKQPVKSLSLSKSVLAVKKGSSYTLKTKVAPSNASNKKVKYTSSNSKVASVNSKGKITAKKAGTAKITVTATDGSKKKAVCQVTVYTAKMKKAAVTPSSKTLNVGQTVTLKTKVTSPKSGAANLFSFKSSNKKVATVDSKGKVKAVRPGTVTITGTALDGSKVTVKAKITVKQPVKSIALNKTAATLVEKQTMKLTASVAPANASNKKVTWTSSNAKAAAVDQNGTVTAIAPGTAKITATAADGSKKSASCTITVKSAVIPVTGITLDRTSLELKANDSAVTLKATVAPANATDKTVTWTSSNKDVVTVQDGTVSITGAGDAVVTAKAGDKTASCTVKVIGETEALTTDGAYYYLSLDKTAEQYKVNYQDKTEERSTEEFMSQAADMKDYWILYQDTEKSLTEIWNSQKMDRMIEKLAEFAGQNVQVQADPSNNAKTVTMEKADGSSLEAVITMTVNEDESCNMLVEQIGGAERSVSITNITRAYTADMTTLNFTVDGKEMKIHINSEADRIEMVRAAGGSENQVALYEELDQAYTMKVNSTYLAEAMDLFDVPFDMNELSVWNVYTAK